ncbi:MAG: hypothetical protein M3Q58_04810 [Bacteroidota bacterium]|nr:hypothetical protein [Bacteroidota bacterium]
MKKLAFIVFLGTLFFVSNVYSQDKQIKFVKPEIGTYQITVTSSKQEILIAQETLIKIQEQRDDIKDKSIVLSEFLTVFIPSRKTISSSAFKPLTEILYE